ncbi:CLUMA_CG018477, isoform A [Clunio marinus]|uniref:CLUMA_CG018477, isoform A n=1 Tax=Clunio marinus TaxID=568069 RepID=A0A1J1J0L4_9DIPT|nr:CLUMA_CG018477, isoform A [Clunio marinus]
MKLIKIQFCFILFLKLAKGNPEGKVYWSSVTYTSNPMYVSGFGVNKFNDTDGNTNFNMTFTQLEDMEKLLITIVIIQNSKDMKDFNRELLRINADTCKLSQGIFKNFVVRNVFRDIRESSNVKFSCPQPKGTFYIRELILPGSIPFVDKLLKYTLYTGEFEFTLQFRAKPFKKKLTNDDEMIVERNQEGFAPEMGKLHAQLD